MKKILIGILIGMGIGYLISINYKEHLISTLDEDASHMADFIRCNLDYFEGDTTLPNEYVRTVDEMISNLLYREDGTPVPLEEYVYCY
jgi:hypothetical protein